MSALFDFIACRYLFALACSLRSCAVLLSIAIVDSLSCARLRLLVAIAVLSFRTRSHLFMLLLPACCSVIVCLFVLLLHTRYFFSLIVVTLLQAAHAVTAAVRDSSSSCSLGCAVFAAPVYCLALVGILRSFLDVVLSFALMRSVFAHALIIFVVGCHFSMCAVNPVTQYLRRLLVTFALLSRIAYLSSRCHFAIVCLFALARSSSCARAASLHR